ncbi:unnamed protein product [Amoebophrya sp. A120]|nr:unnamed protein product [Amoebophrya sp. A120]|eukprot:GSA120T00005691001.1
MTSSSSTSICVAISCEGCGKPDLPDTLGCPQCAKLDLPPAYFCSQDCFKANWSQHKKKHKQVQKWRTSKHLDRSVFAGYKFTGPLRPFPATMDMRPVPLSGKIDLPDWAVTGIPEIEAKANRSGAIPVVSDPAELEKLRTSCRLGRATLDLAGSMVKPGVTPEEIDTAVHDFIVGNNAYPSPLNYRNFPRSVCISVNEVVCHGIPDSRPLENGDIVNVDVTCYIGGYHADLNETFLVGDTCDEDTKRLVRGCYESLQAAIAFCRPGVMYREIGGVISAVAKKHNLSVVRSYCGHGVGKLFHCAPNIPHYERNKAVGTMRVGHVFTIEPMINLGSHHDVTWPDGWTSVTADGKRSAQFEHTMIVTETGVEVLTARTPQSPPFRWDVD